MKAVALFSGGLDSTLAVKVIMNQGIEVIALNFTSPFCCCDRANGCAWGIKKMAEKLGVEFKSVYLGKEYLEIIKNPRHGYGKNLNPCIDCRIFKFKKAKEFMNQIEASFIVTGEVLGQRPMSQHRRALSSIDKESRLEGLVLRPLSAKLFAPTLPEEKGWVKRDSLLSISGRGRKPQIDLASSFGITDYPCPAGGCLLTDSIFSRRIKDLFKFSKLDLNEAKLLRLGRHFRINPGFKLVVGRDEKENLAISNLAKSGDLLFEPKELPGPTAIGRGLVSSSTKEISSRIIARYTSYNKEVEVSIKDFSQRVQELITVKGLEEERLNNFKI